MQLGPATAERGTPDDRRTAGRTDGRATRIGDCNCGGGGGEGRERESVWGGAMVDEAAVVRTFAVGAS